MLLGIGGHQAAAQQRQVYNGESPTWLAAVGKLRVPGSRYKEGRRKHYLEDCSGTLIASSGGRRADTVLTAWHCLEFYDDLSKPIVFTLRPGTSQAVSREAHRIADGGGMHADWALLKLYPAIDSEQVGALLPHPDRADSSRPITMAGFSGDEITGARGAHLTYHSSCHITRQGQGETESDCEAYKGASGGAVVQLSESGKPQLSGVISRGNSENLSIFVPLSRLRGPLKLHLDPG